MRVALDFVWFRWDLMSYHESFIEVTENPYNESENQFAIFFLHKTDNSVGIRISNFR